MIYVTVGNFPDGFNELIQIVDNIAKKNSNLMFLAQISNGSYHPKHMKFSPFFSKEKHLDNINKAKIVISHAGLGSIAEFFENSNGLLIVYPRKKYVHDQIASAKLLNKHYPFLLICSDDELNTCLIKNLENNKRSSFNVNKNKTNAGELIANYLFGGD